MPDEDKLRQLAAWYREFTERAGSLWIWEARLRRAKELEAEADGVEADSGDAGFSIRPGSFSSVFGPIGSASAGAAGGPGRGASASCANACIASSQRIPAGADRSGWRLGRIVS